MTPKKIKTVNVEKSDFKIYLKKAKDFYDTMLKARETEHWTAAGLNAVHCAISCCDAILTFHTGIRSIDEDHMQAVELLQRLPTSIEHGEVMTFKRIIAKKNLIAYDNKEFHQTEAIETSKHAERFYRWTLSKLPAI
jgi:hypothetical protein